ncbi:MAG: SDR family NAD(P)-dependent oxidoreductase [Gammaproteobacteria bacterium]|jgi:3-oxoacyl-[acyl-carrier protein] reductase|nr:SDR family NAD(P)-dependent oxidoreductase [Gammaproteobacteria bacterium]
MATNEVWVVTGASRGIGFAIAQRVAASGDAVALLARGDSVHAAAQSLGERALGLQVDITEETAVAEAINAVAQHFGCVTRLINNAGLHRGGRLGKLEVSDWQAVLKTNLEGTMLMARACESGMSAGSSITNIGAVVGFRGFPGDAAYAASKAGLAGLTQALAIEFAPRDINVNLVIPGLVMTEMTEGLSEKALAALIRMVPKGRCAEPDEIAEVVEWVARARYMTGALVSVDGGLMSTFGSPG